VVVGEIEQPITADLPVEREPAALPDVSAQVTPVIPKGSDHEFEDEEAPSVLDEPVRGRRSLVWILAAAGVVAAGAVVFAMTRGSKSTPAPKPAAVVAKQTPPPQPPPPPSQPPQPPLQPPPAETPPQVATQPPVETPPPADAAATKAATKIDEPAADAAKPDEPPAVTTTDKPTPKAHPTDKKKPFGGKKVVVEYDTQAREARPVADASAEDQQAIAKARSQYAKGNQRLFAGDAAGAIRSYRRALASYPAYVAGYRGLGLAYALKGENAKAAQSLHTYLSSAPGAKDASIIKKRLQMLEGK